MTPSVSVIIPARNEEEYIADALASVAEQRYPLSRIECVVVDNGSADRTAVLARTFAEQHPELAVSIVSEEEPGVSRAKNRGARMATGEIVLFLDADSRLDPAVIEHSVAQYAAGNPAGSIRIVANSTDPLERGFFALMEVGKVAFGIRAQMMYCDRALFLKLGGFNAELRQAEDLDFLRRLRRYLRQHGRGSVCHVRSSAIATSTRRLRGGPLRRNLIATFVRWTLASAGIGRKWEY